MTIKLIRAADVKEDEVMRAIIGESTVTANGSYTANIDAICNATGMLPNNIVTRLTELRRIHLIHFDTSAPALWIHIKRQPTDDEVCADSNLSTKILEPIILPF